jgi:hypothetical protein
MAAIIKIQKLVIAFLANLNEGNILTLFVPESVCHSDFTNPEDFEGVNTNGVYRKLESPESSKAYAQLFAVAALVAEVLTCK